VHPRLRFIFLPLFLFVSLFAIAQEQKADKPPQSIAQFTGGMKKLDGFFPLYWDEKQGKLWLEINKWNDEFLYLDSLPAGVGSNDIGLDRGQMGTSRVVKFERVGPKVLLVEGNYRFRASSPDPLERQSVRDAFAQSVLWGFKVSAEDNGHALVDATDFYLTDPHHVSETIKRTKEGSFHVDANRSAIYLPNTRNFPQNTEVEATLTFAGDDPGKYLREVAPDPRSVTVREHHSFIQLPDANYKPRAFDPRSGYINESYADYSAPIGEPIEKRLIIRHRLQKKYPNQAVSEAVKPIIYYLDSGTPEPVRSALLEGASWWNQAFEAAGFRNAFQVKMLPADADPMDVRYNMIEWVHRATRGWSYGLAVVDPRTGEIIKGHVSLGSLRMRHDYMILQGLLSSTNDPRILQVVLARLRQLAAHEVGHTIGLQHNYIASTDNRASVMDYPPPLVTLTKDAGFDLSQAYATGIGEWDKIAVQYGYTEFKPGADEHAQLTAILDGSIKRGIRFLTDQDARPAGSMNPYTHMWDAGTNAVDELNRVLDIRARALEHFGATAIRPGEPMAMLEDVLVPIYLYHRYQVEAATKVIGGYDYSFAVRGDGETPKTPVDPEEQRRALEAVLKTLAPPTLAIPDKLEAMIPPHPSGVPRTRESFPTNTIGFDPMAAAESAAQITAELLLNPQRAERLIQQHDSDPQALGLAEVMDKLIDASWKSSAASSKLAAVQRVVGDVVLQQMERLASDDHASAEVRAMAAAKLHELRGWTDQAYSQAASSDSQQKAHLFAAFIGIRNFEEGTAQPLKSTQPVEVPPGAPIGMMDMEDDFAVSRPN
jgi:hypothetical protein